MSNEQPRKSKGMTLLRHLMIRVGRRKKINPNGCVALSIGEAMSIVEDFKAMKVERDEALRIMGLRELPNPSLENPVEKKTKAPSVKINTRWANVLKNIK
jgi:hypothetical protein